jgi:hypothetical protein
MVFVTHTIEFQLHHAHAVKLIDAFGLVLLPSSYLAVLASDLLVYLHAVLHTWYPCCL